MGVHQSYYHHPAEPEQESVCVGWSTPPPQSAEKEEEEGTDGTNVDDETRSSASDGDVDCFHPNYSVPFGRSRSDPIGEWMNIHHRLSSVTTAEAKNRMQRRREQRPS